MADRDEWQPVCALERLEVGRGVAALVHGQAVAVFRVDDESVHALANHDPFDHHAVLARGIVGRDGEAPYVASPATRHRFDLRTGRCLEDAHVAVAAFDVCVEDGVVLVGRRKRAAAGAFSKSAASRPGAT